MSPVSHESWKEQLPGYLLGALSPGEQTDLEHHMGGCAECQSELRWLEPSVVALAASVDQVEPPADLKRRVMGAVAEDLTRNPVVEEKPEPEGERPPRRRGGLGWLLRPATVGFAALALIAGIFAGYLIRGDDESPAPAVTERTIAGDETNGSDAVLVTSGDTGRLEISNLEQPERGQVYQAWILKGETVLPTDALFVPRGDGTATASIPDLTGVDAVMISSEPSGGSEAPTTTPVITISMPS